MEWIATASRRRRQPFSLIESLKWLFPQKYHQDHISGEIEIEAQRHFEVREIRATFQELSENKPVMSLPLRIVLKLVASRSQKF
jgi:hypothetical protein